MSNLSLTEKLKLLKNTSGYSIIFDQKKVIKNSFFSSGSLIIDRLTGINGYPIKGIIEIFGQPSTGKTTLALHAISEFQKLNQKKTIFFDLERTLNFEYAQKIGVNIDNLIILNPKNAEETFDLIIDFLKTKEVCLIVLDSVAALLPETEENNSMSDNTIGLQARIMSKALRKINYLLSETNSSIIFINQIREKINTFFSNPEITTGGNALKFYSSLRIQLRHKGKIVIKNENKGINVGVKIIKNKRAKPFEQGIISIFFNKGINKMQEILELAVFQKIVLQKGAWYFFKDVKLGIGREKALEFLLQNPKILEKIKTTIK